MSRLVGAGFLLLTLSPVAGAQEEGEWTFDDQLIDVRTLIEICSNAFDIVIEWDPGTLAGEVWLSSATRYTEEEVWAFLNRELASRDVITVQPPGSEALRVVPIGEAAGLARLEDLDLSRARAGFVKVLIPLEHRSAEELVEGVRSLVSQPHGSVTPVRDGNALVVADLLTHVGQVLRLIDLLDRREVEPVVEEITLEYASPIALVVLLDQVTATRKKVVEEELKGTALPLVETKSMLVVAPVDEVEWWRRVIERFDRPEPVDARQYTPRRFGLFETARLLEEVVRDPAEGAWRLVTDELTGTLIVTTTPTRHAEIRELLDRLESAEAGPRRPLRAFVVRNRQVAEVLGLLQSLVDAGVLDKKDGSGTASAEEGGSTRGATAPIPATYRPPGRSASSGEVPEVTLTADEGTNRILAFGEATVLDQLGVLIEELDVRHAQVLVETLVVVMTEDETRALGVELQGLGIEGNTMFQIASLFGLGSPDPLGTTLPPASGTGFSTAVLNPGDFSAIIRALETLSKGRSLTVPKVLVNNNQEASLDSVVQTPYATINASNTVATTSFGGTFDAGTTISVKPQVADGDQIVMDYSVSLSRFTGEAADPSLPPPRQETSLASIVTVPDGHTIVVGGLSIDSETETTSEVPVLGDIPIVEHLFQDRSRTKSKSRFFVFLKCSVMNSASFEDLRYWSGGDMVLAGVDDGWPELEPRLIR